MKMWSSLCRFKRARNGAPLGPMIQNLRAAVRTIRHRPGFAFSVVVLLGMALWMNTTVYSVIHAVMLAPLPFDHPEELVRLYEGKSDEKFGPASNYLCPTNFADWRADNRSFQEMAAFVPGSLDFQRNEIMDAVAGAMVTTNFFKLLRIRPVIGRDFVPEDVAAMGNIRDSVQGIKAAIISYAFWQRQFGSNPSVIGTSMILRNTFDHWPEKRGLVTVRIVGVMPGTIASASASLCAADIWLPIVVAEDENSIFGNFLNVVARKRPGISGQQIRGEMDVIANRLKKGRPDINDRLCFRMAALGDLLPGNYRASLLALAGAVMVILLIACANVANLMLAHGAARFREMATRAAIGARRFHLVTQMVTECLLLSLIGGVLALVLSLASVRTLVAIAPPEIPRIGEAGISLPVFGFCFAISLFTGLLCGIIPALWISKFDFGPTLKEGAAASAGASIGRFSRFLVVFEIALSCVLLVGAGLLAHSFASVQRIRFGFQSDHVLTVELRHDPGLPDLLAHLRPIPGIQAVAGGSIPLSRGWGMHYAIDGKTMPMYCKWDIVDTEYFRILRVPLVLGRLFSDSDHAGALPVAILNRTAARLTWPGEDPIGKRIYMDNKPLHVIGVVGDVPNSGGHFEVMPEVYVPRLQSQFLPAALLLRTAGSAGAMATAVRESIHSFNSGLVIKRMGTLEDRFAKATAGLRFNTLLMSIFAVLAFLLAAMGVYSLMSYIVTMRTRELSIRMAMGANRAHILLLVLRMGTLLAGLGMALGLAGALGATRFLSSLLYQVKPHDPISFILAAVLLSAAVLAACYFPARRVARGEIAGTLRHE